MTAIVLVVSDLHIGSTVAMLPDNLRVYDGVSVKPSKAQRWIKSKWLRMLDDVDEMKKKHNARLISVCNGDLIDGDHHGTFQLVTDDQHEQARMAIDILDPLSEMSEKMVFVRGTPTHVGREGRWDNMVAMNFDNADGLESGNASHWHAKFEVEGVRFDVAHHSTQSTIIRNSANSITQLASEITYAYLLNGEKPPHLAVRSHRHIYKTSGIGNFPTEAIQTPAWQLGTSYVKGMANPNILADIGYVAFICDNGEYKQVVKKHHPRPAKMVQL